MDTTSSYLREGLALLGRHGGISREEEEAGLLAMDRTQRDLVLRRAIVIDRFLRLPKRTTADADAAAAELSVARSNFYRMVERYRIAGMVGGLAPHSRLPKRAPLDEASSDEWVLNVLANELRRNPGVRLKELLIAVHKHAAATGREAPSASAVQRRVSRLRSRGDTSVSALGAPVSFGRELLIDRCAIDEWVSPDSDREVFRRQPTNIGKEVCTFVVDCDTRLIIGAGVDPLPFATEGFEGALVEADAFWSRPLIGSMIPVSPERITWVLPVGFQRMADPFLAAAAKTGIAAEAILHGERRFGERLRKLIGDRIGPYRLMPRMTSNPLPTERLPEPADVRHPAEIGIVLALIIEEWNLEIVRLHEGGQRKVTDPARRARRRRWTKLKRLEPSAPQWLAALLLPGRPLVDLSPDWGVNALRLNGVPTREQVEQIKTRKLGWLPPIVVASDQPADGGASQL